MTKHCAGCNIWTGPWGKAKGIAIGTVVMTADGALPVEYIEPGDRIVTQRGMQVLRAVRAKAYSGPAVVIRSGAAGPRQPEQDLILLEAALLLPRCDPGAARTGRINALLPVVQAVAPDFILRTTVRDLIFFDLCFDAAQIVHLDGVEMLCDTLAEQAIIGR